jgi:hypothetical protein
VVRRVVGSDAVASHVAVRPVRRAVRSESLVTRTYPRAHHTLARSPTHRALERSGGDMSCGATRRNYGCAGRCRRWGRWARARSPAARCSSQALRGRCARHVGSPCDPVWRRMRSLEPDRVSAGGPRIHVHATPSCVRGSLPLASLTAGELGWGVVSGIGRETAKEMGRRGARGASHPHAPSPTVRTCYRAPLAGQSNNPSRAW